MRIGLVGLGRMGGGIARRLLSSGHEIVGFDQDPELLRALESKGGIPASSVHAMVARLDSPRTVWIMVPHGSPTRTTLEALLELLSSGDLIIDGGNSPFRDALTHAERCSERGVDFLDVGVSGGVWGESQGFNLMIGGPSTAFQRLEPVFSSLTPQGGYAHVGRNGSGHFVKMMHNAIEYGMLQAIGEGFECLHRSEFDLDVAQVAELWQNGAVVRSWLLQLVGKALREEGSSLENIAPYVDDSGTGHWAVEYALSQGIPLTGIAVSLFERFDSRSEGRYAHQVIAALRNQFGGHAIRSPEVE